MTSPREFSPINYANTFSHIKDLSDSEDDDFMPCSVGRVSKKAYHNPIRTNF